MTNGEKSPQPFQFSLRHVFALLLALSVFLALVTQLRHVGFVAACFLGGIAGGSWFRRPRLIPASITGLAVFVVVYLACWAQLGYIPLLYRLEYGRDHLTLEIIRARILEYTKAHGEAPDSLEDLHGATSFPKFPSEDYWGHPFHYQKTPNGFELSSLGKDGRPGGDVFDADLYVGEKWNSSKMRVPLWHFLFKAPGSGIVFNVAWIASLAAGAIWFAVQGREPFRVKWHLAGVAAIAVAAVLVAVFLASFYVLASGSGH